MLTGNEQCLVRSYTQEACWIERSLSPSDMLEGYRGDVSSSTLLRNSLRSMYRGLLSHVRFGFREAWEPNMQDFVHRKGAYFSRVVGDVDCQQIAWISLSICSLVL